MGLLRENKMEDRAGCYIRESQRRVSRIGLEGSGVLRMMKSSKEKMLPVLPFGKAQGKPWRRPPERHSRT